MPPKLLNMLLALPCCTTLLLLLGPSVVTGQNPLTDETTNAHGIAFPVTRYRQYEYLSEEMKALIGELGYTESTWNHPGSDTIELISYEGLSPDAQAVVRKLNITKGQWDCYINHYKFLDWSELSFIVETDNFGKNGRSNVINVQQYYEMLGWTEDMWTMSKVDDNEIPDSELYFWDELSPEQIEGAKNLCYFEHTWNDQMLQEWTTAPPTLAPTMSPTVRPPTDEASVSNNADGGGDGGKNNGKGSSATTIAATGFHVVVSIVGVAVASSFMW